MNKNFLSNIKKLKDLIDIKINEIEENRNLLIVDRGTIDPMIRTSIVAQILNEKKKLNPIVLSVYKSNSWRSQVYRSFGIKKFLQTPRLKLSFLYPLILIKSLFIFCKSYFIFIFKDFRWLIYNFKIYDINIGDLIYDSYIRHELKFANPKKIDSRLIYLFLLAIYKTVFINTLIEKKKISYVLVSTGTYVNDSSIALRLAAQKKIPALYVFWFLLIFHDSYESTLLSRRKIFKSDIENLDLPDNWLQEFEKYATSRYSGRIEYRDFLNAYKNKMLINNDELFKKLNISKGQYSHIALIAPHAFSDASHESFEMIFNDYYDHFIQTLNFIKDKKELDDVLWVVNPHPSSHVFKEEGFAEKIINKINKKNIVIFPQDVNVFSILKIVDTVVTCRGTIGLEFPACFEKKSIIAGEAPYSGFNFLEEPVDKKSYFKAILNIKNISKLTDAEKILAKKVFYFYECLQLESFTTSILPINRFLQPDKFLEEIILKLEKSNFKKDQYYLKTIELIMKRN